MIKTNSSFIILLLSFASFYSCNKKQSNDNDTTIQTEKSFEGGRVNTDDYNDTAMTGGNFDFLPTSTTNQIVNHSYYTLSYNEEFEQAEWVAYELKKSHVQNSNFKRPYFIEDAKVTTGSADWRNYKNSGYDKGHLCPAGDMAFDQNAYNDTFLTSNISPQDHKFNEGVWNRLEQKVRYWAVKYDGLYVVTGGVLESSLPTIGKEKVSVPKYFYKVLMSTVGNKSKMIAFLVPNEKSDKPLYEFVVSVDSIEKLTGIDFFPKLEDKVEDILERNTDYKDWSFK